MARGIYFGDQTLEAEEASAFKQLKKKWKQHGKRQGKKLSIRNLVSTGMDIAGELNPWAKAAKPFVDYATQELTPFDKFEEEAGFWTAEDIAEMKSEDKEFREGADTTLLENILGEAAEYAGTPEGIESIGDFNIADLFGGGDSSLSVEDMKMGYGGGGGSSYDTSNPWNLKKGGKVPKFKKGGIFEFGKKKKESKVPERDEALMVLDAILSSKPPVGKHEYERNGSGGYTLQTDVIPGGWGWMGRQIAEFDTPEGKRYYPGEGTSQDMGLSLIKALGDATQRKNVSPADSITTNQFAKLKELGLFEGGGMVQGGGTTPSIVNYFAKQNKTLGGSNTDSLAQRLGRI